MGEGFQASVKEYRRIEIISVKIKLKNAEKISPLVVLNLTTLGLQYLVLCSFGCQNFGHGFQ